MGFFVWSESGVVPFTKECLTNKKVCHDGTAKDNLNFDVFQDNQSQNDFSTTQLNVMGYKGGALKVQFMEDKIWERPAAASVMVPHPRLASARGRCGHKYAWQEVFCCGT